MENPRLNYDVLIRILQTVAFCGRKAELVPIMQTCRTLHHAGVPLLIRNGIDVRGRKSVVSFCVFMLTDATRFRYLRRLTLSVVRLPRNERMDSVLARVFEHMRHLDKLYISDPEILDYYPAMTEAIAALTTLKILHMGDGECARENSLHEMLLHLKSEIHSLAVTFYSDYKVTTDMGEVIELLEGVAPHLERLYVHFAAFLVDDGPQYPRLKVLTCDKITFMNYCHPLIRAFPNLTHLCVSPSLARQDNLQPFRLENIETQQRLRWHHLAFLSGSLASLYGLALQCTVSTLHLEADTNDSRDLDPTLLSAVLSDTPPNNLVMNIGDRFPFSSMPDVFQGAALRLDHLVIKIYIDHGEEVTPQQIFESILLTLSETRLTFFRLHLEWEPSDLLCMCEIMRDDDFLKLFFCSCMDPTERRMPEPRPMVQFLQSLDPIVCSRQLMDCVPTLKTIVLDWKREPQPELFVGVVEEEEGVRSLKVLDEKTANDVLQQAISYMHSDVLAGVSRYDVFTPEWQ